MAVIKGGSPKPLSDDDAKNNPTGWSNDFDSQMGQPKDWGDPGRTYSGTPKTDHKGQDRGRKGN